MEGKDEIATIAWRNRDSRHLDETADELSVTDGILFAIPSDSTNPTLKKNSDVVVHSNPEGQPAIIRTYKSRFWILFIFSVVTYYQCTIWNTWSPISSTMAAAFPGWGPGTVALLANWATITFVVFVFPISWYMNAHGLRGPMVVFAALITIGTVLRCFTEESTVFTVMCHLCAILVGISGPGVLSGAGMVAAVWFPPKERITATAVIIASNQLGTTGSYLQPLLVKAPGPDVSIEDMRWSVMELMFSEASIAVFILIAVVAYFPSQPPYPPSLSSSKERLRFLPALQKMIKNTDLILVFLSFSATCVVPFAWVGVLNYSLKDLGIQQDGAMGIGIALTICQAVSGVVAGRLADMMYGHLKATLIGFIIATCGCSYWFGLLSWGTIPVAEWQVYASLLGIFSFNFATMPLFIEYAVEMAYPCPEQIVVAAMYTWLEMFTFVFLIIFAVVPEGSYGWLVYCLLGSNAFGLFSLLLTKENYARTKLDDASRQQT